MNFRIAKSNIIPLIVVGVSLVACEPTPQGQEKLEEPTSIKESRSKILVAGYAYDRIQAIKDSRVGLEQADVTFETANIYALNANVFGSDQSYDVAEIGLIPYISKYINNDFRDYTLIPVFISRIFRHRNIFVHADSGIEKPEDLIGKRIGTPGYGMSANTWIRGMLLDEYGIAVDDFDWIETQESSDGGKLNKGFNKYFFGDDFPISKGPEGMDESDLLLNGQCDALITAITPKAFLEGDPRIKRLFNDVKTAEMAYYENSRMFPIMHVVAIRNELIDKDPDLPKAVFEMYSKAKSMTYADLETTTSLKVTLPWVTQEFEETRELMGENFWKYGIEANRKELETLMRYVHEQGLVKRRIEFEELFVPSTLTLEE